MEPPPTVTRDLWILREAAATLTPPGRSVVDGEVSETVVRTCVLYVGFRRLEMSLTVDDATARKFARVCRLHSIFQYRVTPILLGGAVGGLAVVIAGLFSGDDRLLDLVYPFIFPLVVVPWLTRLVLWLQRSPHHPMRRDRYWLRVRRVHHAAADDWIHHNPPGVILIDGWHT